MEPAGTHLEPVERMIRRESTPPSARRATPRALNGCSWLLLSLPVVCALGCQTTTREARDAGAAPSAKPLAERTLGAPKSLSLTARALLSRRMENHGFEMSNLLWATLLLDRATAADIAGSILAEPRLARPIDRSSHELNSQLPEAFFNLQDQLVAAAQRLQTVARNEEATPDDLAGAFGGLTRTCVNCHAVYLDGD